MSRFKGSDRERAVLSAFVKLMRGSDSLVASTHGHLKGEELTVSQFGVLEALFHLGPMCQKELAERILKSPGNMTTVLRNLEMRGLVYRKRSSDDRRFSKVHLTRDGESLIAEVFPRHLNGLVKAFDTFTAEELSEFVRLCRKLNAE